MFCLQSVHQRLTGDIICQHESKASVPKMIDLISAGIWTQICRLRNDRPAATAYLVREEPVAPCCFIGFIRMHVEKGSTLDYADKAIGVVDGIVAPAVRPTASPACIITRAPRALADMGAPEDHEPVAEKVEDKSAGDPDQRRKLQRIIALDQAAGG